MENLEKDLRIDLITICDESKKIGYNPTRFLQMLYQWGPVEAVKKILVNKTWVQDGLTILWKKKRLDLSIEYLLSKNKKYNTLFSNEELKEAKNRIKKLHEKPIKKS